MDIRGIDPRDTKWEQDHADYRVYFWDREKVAAYEYEILNQVDIEELLHWAMRYAADRNWSYTIYASVIDGDRPGLIRLAGVLGDPFVDV